MRNALMMIPVFALVLGGPAAAADLTKIELTIKDHRFTPSEIHVPAGKPALLTIKNEDPTPEEFDSSALQIEKVVIGGGTGMVRLRPLGPGRYPFIGEYHSATAQGVVVAK
jgi:hypothetical protein